MTTFTRWAAFLLTPVLLIGLCSCSSSEHDSAASYQEMFARFSEKAPNDRVREILESGAISDTDYQEILDGFKKCLGDHGITLTGINATGGTETDDPHYATRGDALPVEDCGTSTGFDLVSHLYHSLKNNPDNVDQSKLIAACFVREKIVDGGYSARDYERDLQDQNSLLYHPGSEARLQAVIKCKENPTHQS